MRVRQSDLAALADGNLAGLQRRDARQGIRCPLMMGSPNHGHPKQTLSLLAQAKEAIERFDLQKDFEWRLRQSHPAVQSLDQLMRHKDRPASLDPAPLGRSVPMPKHPMQYTCVQARLLGSPRDLSGRAAPNQRSLTRPLVLGLQIPVLLHPRDPKRRFLFRRVKSHRGWAALSRLRARAGHSLSRVMVRAQLAQDPLFLLFVGPLAPTAQSRVGRC